MNNWIAIHCTYCWQKHYSLSLDHWIKHNRAGCGKDKGRYFFTHKDYIAYVRAYEANGYQHIKNGSRQLSLLEPSNA